MNSNAVAPFSCHFTSQVPELLHKLNCSLALSTYQAGKVILLSPDMKENRLTQLPRNFEKPMGICSNENGSKWAVACKDEVIVFSKSDELAAFYPKNPNKYDTIFLPRATYHTGGMDIHDLAFGKDGKLYAVNTLFSCIVVIDDHFNFTPYWKPGFIDQYVSEDRCHLNGMAMQNGLPKYATAFNEGNSFQSWRENVTTSGVIFDLETNKVICRNLPMPHSPRIYNGQLYVLLSATGELAKVNTENGSYEVVKKINGFVRGMSLYKDYLFIGLSKLRKNSSTFAKLPFAENANRAGLAILHLPTASIAGEIVYEASVDEIYDVHVIADKLRPNILNTLTPEHKLALMIPGNTFWAKPSNEANN